MQPTPLAAARRFTLAELTVVLLILALTAGAVRLVTQGRASSAQKEVAERVSFGVFQRAIEQYRQDMPSAPLPTSLKDLWIKPDAAPDYDPVYRVGWNGPYVVTNGSIPRADSSEYSRLSAGGLVPVHYQVGDAVVLDPYGRPYVWLSKNDSGLGAPYRILSAGRDGKLEPLTVPDDEVDDHRSEDFQ